MKKNNKGFTLVELIVVIAILGVLMAVLVPQYIQYVEKSRIGTDEALAGEAAHAMEVAAALTEDHDATMTISTTGATLADADANLTTEITSVITLAECKLVSKEYEDGITVTLTDGAASWAKTVPDED